ncbi:MAG TPA: hypothetical protein VD999_00160 [Vitreimonas sp.]|nr:hypothetical protein [Vitreimonas sp.]
MNTSLPRPHQPVTHAELKTEFAAFRAEMKQELLDMGSEIANILLKSMQSMFDELKVRIDKHDEQFEKIDQRFDKLEGHFDSLEIRYEYQEKRLDHLVSDVSDIKKRVTRVESKVDINTSGITEIKHHLKTFITRDELEQRLKKRAEKRALLLSDSSH